SADNAKSIAAICRHLDGIPLAIELAAARVATLGVRQVAAGPSDRVALLNSRRRTALPRHQNPPASPDWSSKLLSQPGKLLLRQLSIFAGDFSFEAVLAVTKAANANLNDVTDNLASLVSKSLVNFDGATTADRWRLLETIRAYGLNELRDANEY